MEYEGTAPIVTSFNDLIVQSSAHAWLFLPTAILLGALHGLEPGHSKTMMAAFIIAIRGTVAQAVLLGLSAAISHSLLIWVLALGALHFGSQWNAETTEPYFQMVSGALIIAMAVWMFLRTRRDQPHTHAPTQHPKDGETHYAVYQPANHPPAPLRDDPGFQDAHERQHAEQIARRFAGQTVTTPQIILFGLTGGLLPCPAALTVLLICLQLKKLVLGFALVAAFSLGLALTMVATGAIAALSVQHASRHFQGFGEWARKAPYISSILLLAMGLFIGLEGWHHLR